MAERVSNSRVTLQKREISSWWQWDDQMYTETARLVKHDFKVESPSYKPVLFKKKKINGEQSTEVQLRVWELKRQKEAKTPDCRKLSNNLWLEIELATLKAQPAITLRPSPYLLLLDDRLNMSRAISNRAAIKTASWYPPDMSHGVAVFSFSCLDKSHYCAVPYISAQTEMNSRPIHIVL